jgi:high-affinity iron transporter
MQSTVYRTLDEDKKAAWVIFSLIFIAVFREGLETVLFIIAEFQSGLIPVLGAIGGLTIAVLIGMVLFKWSIRINLSQFLQWIGILLLIIVSGLVISALRHLDAVVMAYNQINAMNICQIGSAPCILGLQIWDFSDKLLHHQFPRILLKIMVGYNQKLYLAQALVYILFWLIIGGLYFCSINQTTRLKLAANINKLQRYRYFKYLYKLVFIQT